jgi:dTDP-4-dehydrorhamnose 3,5-epimerase
MSSIKPALFPKLKQHLEVHSLKEAHAFTWPEGVHFFPLNPHHDDRGFFMEIIRASFLEKKSFIAKQISISETKKGVIKAFHFHRDQSDLFCPISGKFRIVLFDVRERSASYALGISIFTDIKNPFVLHIPPGVAHGYEVLSESPGTMLYIMNREYNPADELRADWDDPKIAFPWK